MQNGIQHNGSIAGTFHVLKYFNWDTGITVTTVITLHIREKYVPSYKAGKIRCSRYHPAICQHRRECPQHHSNTRLYGMYQFNYTADHCNPSHVIPHCFFYLYADFVLLHGVYYRYAVNDTI